MRCRLAIIGLLALSPVAASVGWWLMPEPRLTEDNCERIREGMTLAEVAEILGGGPMQEEITTNNGDVDAVGTWDESGRMIVVVFSNGRVVRAIYRQSSLWECIDDWYHDRVWSPWGRGKRLEAAA